MTISRKRFFKDAATCLVGAAAGVVGSSIVSTEPIHAETQMPSWPWPYSPLDPEQGRVLAHECFYEYGCGYAAFAGMLKLLQDKMGDPFTSIPPQMMSYGGAGVKGWGTLCGTLNGVSAVIALVRDMEASSLIIDELMSWYAQTRLPTDTSNQYGENGRFKVNKNIKVIPQSRSRSPLCHVSVTRWCKASQFTADSPERLERCARLAGDVVAQAILLLNKHAQNEFETRHGVATSTLDCLKCHGPKRDEADVLAKMDCVQCHGDPHR